MYCGITAEFLWITHYSWHIMALWMGLLCWFFKRNPSWIDKYNLVVTIHQLLSMLSLCGTVGLSLSHWFHSYSQSLRTNGAKTALYLIRSCFIAPCFQVRNHAIMGNISLKTNGSQCTHDQPRLQHTVRQSDTRREKKRFWISVALYQQCLPWNDNLISAYLANNTTIFCLSFKLISDYYVFVHLQTESLVSVASVLHLLTGLLFSTAPSINKGLDAAARACAL